MINVIKIRKKQRPYDIVLNIAVLAQFLYWLLSAPLSRYGSIILFLIPCMVLIHMLENKQKTVIKCYQKAMPVLLAALMIALTYQTVICIEKIPLKRSSYYVYRECNEIEWEGIMVYGPIENSYTGYYKFPGITCVSRLPYMELRGSTLKDGFRIKEEYKQVKLTPGGTIIEQ